MYDDRAACQICQLIYCLQAKIWPKITRISLLKYLTLIPNGALRALFLHLGEMLCIQKSPSGFNPCYLIYLSYFYLHQLKYHKILWCIGSMPFICPIAASWKGLRWSYDNTMWRNRQYLSCKRWSHSIPLITGTSF